MAYQVEVKSTPRLEEFLRESLGDENLEKSTLAEVRRLLDSGPAETIPFRLIRDVFGARSSRGGKKIYLHELIEGSDIHLPEYKAPPRNSELEARIQKLKAEEADREYRKMTKNVDLQQKQPLTLGKELKIMNNQIIAAFNFILTVGGAFAFGYKITEMTLEKTNIPLQLTMGMVLGTVVFFADLYFLVNHLM